MNNIEKPTHTQVIGITSGKSGVGKTTVSVNLAVALHDMGYNVMILDANTSVANAQAALGSPCPFKLEDFLSGKKSLKEIILKRRYGIQLVAGASAIRDMTTLSPTQANRALQEFGDLEADLDFLIVDMPPGTEMSVLSFMASTSRRFLVIRNDAAGLTDAYSMIKVLCSDYKLDDIYIIVNGAQTEAEGKHLFDHLNLISTKFLQRSLHYLGCLQQDELIVEASKNHKAISEFAPTSTGARDIRHLAKTTSSLALQTYVEGGIAHFLQRMFHLHDLTVQKS
jgi:flagellar biosynthesis protein FlhG